MAMLVLWLIYCGIITSLEIGTLMVLGPPGPFGEMFAILITFNMAQCASVTGMLLALLAVGFCLVRVGRSMELHSA